MSERVLLRFCVIAGIATFLMFLIWGGMRYLNPPAGDYEVRQGDILLQDGEFNAAVARFDAALKKSPNHRGALMGIAIAKLQQEEYDQARSTLDGLIDFLTNHLVDDDPTGRAVLAAAFANRGILFDRTGNHRRALQDYEQALRVDRGAVAGPDIVQRVLYGLVDASSVEKRAGYLRAQFALPESERRLRIPERDERQRMHKP